MTRIKVKPLLCSTGVDAPPVYTSEWEYPYIIHGEVMTHRVFTRNAASFRAIPTQKLLDDLRNDPFIPIHWGKNQRGMQAFEEINTKLDIIEKRRPLFGFIHRKPRVRSLTAEQAWLEARDRALVYAEAFLAGGYHKQVANRLLLPFLHMRTQVTSVYWRNFEVLRDHPDAEPHIRALAQRWLDAKEEMSAKDSIYNQFLLEGEWHTPWVSPHEYDIIDGAYVEYSLDVEQRKKLSAERSARLSYKTHDGKNTKVDLDFRLFNSLIIDAPMHASPVEHVLSPDTKTRSGKWRNPSMHGNTTGWKQMRKEYEHERAYDDWEIV